MKHLKLNTNQDQRNIELYQEIDVKRAAKSDYETQAANAVFNSLPLQLILRMLYFCPLATVLQAASVCKKWHDVLEHSPITRESHQICPVRNSQADAFWQHRCVDLQHVVELIPKFSKRIEDPYQPIGGGMWDYSKIDKNRKGLKECVR